MPVGRPGRASAVAAAAVLVLAGCGSKAYTDVSFRNDLRRPVQVGLCRADTCRSVEWWIGVDPQAVATEQVPGTGRTSRFVVVGPPDTVYGCLAFAFHGHRPAVTVPLSTAHVCGSGR